MQLNPWMANLIIIAPIVIIIGFVLWMLYLIIIKQVKGDLQNNRLQSHYVNVFGLKIRKRAINLVFLILGGLPLLLSPFVFLADVMLLASIGETGIDNNIKQGIGTLAVILFINLYILTYIYCLLKNSKKKDESIIFTSLPLIHITIIVILINILM
jgi:hypothetical protein